MEDTEKQRNDDAAALAKIKEKSDDDYEKNITYISAGTLVLSLTFIEKIVNLGQSSAVWCLIISWVFMGATLLINLFSHQLASHYAQKSDEEYRLDIADLATFRKRNSKLRNLNWSTTGTLSLGMLFLIVFCSINAFKMSEKVKIETATVKTKMDTAVANPQNTEKKGRTVIIPSSVLKPVVTSSSNEAAQSNNTQNPSNEKTK